FGMTVSEVNAALGGVENRHGVNPSMRDGAQQPGALVEIAGIGFLDEDNRFAGLRYIRQFHDPGRLVPTAVHAIHFGITVVRPVGARLAPLETLIRRAMIRAQARRIFPEWALSKSGPD